MTNITRIFSIDSFGSDSDDQRMRSSMSKGSDPGVDFSVTPIRDSCILYQHFRSIFTRCSRRFLMRRVIVVYPSFKGGNIWTLTSRSTHEQPSSQKQIVTSLPSSSSRSSFTDTPTVGSSAFGLRKFDLAQARSKLFRVCDGIYRLTSESSVCKPLAKDP